MCFGTEVGPHAGRPQLIDSTLNAAFSEGSQSAPIGTPLKDQLLKCYQRIAPGAAGVPFRSAMTLAGILQSVGPGEMAVQIIEATVLQVDDHNVLDLLWPPGLRVCRPRPSVPASD